MRPPAWKSAGLAFACFLAAVVFSWAEPGKLLDARAYDTFLWLRQPAPRPRSVVVVALDEPTLSAYGGVAELRPMLDKLLQVIAPAGAKAVVVDVQLSDRQRPEWDEPLRRALNATPNLVLASTMVEDPATKRLYWEDPLPEFAEKAALGHVHAEPDWDGVNRHVLLLKATDKQRRWALALEAFRLVRNVPRIRETENSLEVGGVSIPASDSTKREQRPLRIRYLPKDAVDRISAKDLIEQPALASRLRDRVAFIGETYQGGPDRLMTPYSAKFGEKMPGVEVHAQLYETLARGDFLVSVSLWVLACWRWRTRFPISSCCGIRCCRRRCRWLPRGSVF